MTSTVWHETRQAFQHLRQNPQFTAAAVAMLAVAIGANAALYSVTYGIMLRKVAVSEPDRLVVLSRVEESGRRRGIPTVSLAEIVARQQVLEQLGGYAGPLVYTQETDGVATNVLAEGVSGDYFGMLGVQPLLGRTISPQEAPLTGPSAPVVVLAHHYWSTRFRGDPGVIGTMMNVQGVPLTVIGVTPPGFTGLLMDVRPDLTIPAGIIFQVAAAGGTPVAPSLPQMVGRLRSGVALSQVQAHVETLWPAAEKLAGRDAGSIATKLVAMSAATGMPSTVRTRYGTVLPLLHWLTVALLLVTAVNLGGLLLARAAARQRELAVRLAIGATPARLALQLTAESLLVTAMGFLMGVPLAWAMSANVGRVLASSAGLLPMTAKVTPDTRVLLMALGVSLAVGLIAGLVPALAARRLMSGTRLNSRGVTAPARAWGKALVAAQVAISLALLFCATLLVRSLANVSALDRGFDSRAVVVARLHPRPGGYRTINNSVYYPDLARRVSELPGVESVAMSQYFPVANVDRPRPVMSEGSGEPLVVQAAREAVSPRFFETMGISLLQGRDFSWLDDQGKPAVCILNATLASQLFPATSAIGRRIRVGQAPQVQVMEIVGIAGDVPVRGIHVPLLFRPQLQEPALARQPALALRTRLTGAEIGPMLRRVVPAAGHEYVLDLRTLNDYVNISMAQERLAAPIAALFGWIAMGLVFAGQYSLLAMSVTRRTHEIGVRLALGASTASVLRLILRDGIGITTLGIVVGIPIAASLGHAASAFLFGVSPTDPLVLLGAIVVIVSVTTAACVVPSHRACGVSPLVSMSTE